MAYLHVDMRSTRWRFVVGWLHNGANAQARMHHICLHTPTTAEVWSSSQATTWQHPPPGSAPHPATALKTYTRTDRHFQTQKLQNASGVQVGHMSGLQSRTFTGKAYA